MIWVGTSSCWVGRYQSSHPAPRVTGFDPGPAKRKHGRFVVYGRFVVWWSIAVRGKANRAFAHRCRAAFYETKRAPFVA